jgi:hypothetical protein
MLTLFFWGGGTGGGGGLLTYYVWDGPEPLYNFNFPEGVDAGEYSLLIGGLTVPLITAQVITGKVTFVQKTQQGFDNGTGVYELDLTLVDNFELAWRSMYVHSQICLVVPEAYFRVPRVPCGSRSTFNRLC